MNNILDESNILCSGCGVCVYSCPKKCIRINQNNAFYSASIEDSSCIKCGLCKNSCYRFSNMYTSSKTISFCLRTNDNEILKKSSSGGLSCVLMKKLIENGYVVYGFGYDISKAECKMFKAQTVDELKIFFGSKYFQANTYNDDIFRDILSEPHNKKMAFFGTPCIIAGIRTFLSRLKYENLFFVDLFCHGVPSDLLWKKYIKYIETKTGKTKIVLFRSKKYGWHTYSNNVIGDRSEYSSVNDKYFELYFSGLFINPSCFGCKVKNNFSNSDIRLGDAWGPTHDKDKRGVSLVACNTKKGKELLESCHNNICVFKNISEKEINNYQSIYSSKFFSYKNKDFIELLLSDSSFQSVYREFLRNLTLKEKIKRCIKKLFNIAPFGFKQLIKQFFHKRF